MNKDVQIIEKHSRAIRWFHWINFPLILMMVWSGLLIYWAHRAYLPISDEFSQKLHISGRLAEGLGWHFMLMWFFVLNGIFYLTYLLISKEWRFIFPNRKTWKQSVQVLLTELKLKKFNTPPGEKFNGAQKIAYTLILFNGIFATVTGLAIYKPVQLGWLTELLGGYAVARFEHFVAMIIFVLFFVVHLLQVLKAGWNNFRAMVSGYEIKKSETK